MKIKMSKEKERLITINTTQADVFDDNEKAGFNQAVQEITNILK